MAFSMGTPLKATLHIHTRAHTIYTTKGHLTYTHTHAHTQWVHTTKGHLTHMHTFNGYILLKATLHIHTRSAYAMKKKCAYYY